MVDALGRVDLNDAPAEHDGHAIRHGHGFGLIVRDVENGRAQPPPEQDEFRAHVDAQLCVEVGQRFVHQESLWVPRDRASQSHPLPLPARKLSRLAIEKEPKTERFGNRDDDTIDVLSFGPAGSREAPEQRKTLGARQFAHDERNGQVLSDRHVRVERVGLENHRDVAILRRHAIDGPTVDPDLSRGRRFETRDDPQQRRFSASGRSQQTDELAVGDIERHPVQHGGLVVALCDVADGNCGHRDECTRRLRTLRQRLLTLHVR